MAARYTRLIVPGIVVILLVGFAFSIWQSLRLSLGIQLERSSHQLAYLQYDTQGANVYVLDTETESITQLTTNNKVYGITWSADGERMLLSLRGDIETELVVANGETRTIEDSGLYFKTFSPDQTQFAYDRCPADTGSSYGWHETASIFIEEAANLSQIREITNACFPTWSPQGDQIAFTSQQSGDVDPEIYIQDMDGSNVRRLVTNIGADITPLWSPAGNRLAFRSELLSQDPNFPHLYLENLYLVDVTGQNLTKIDSTDPRLSHVRWSPDGQTLLYTSIAGDLCFVQGDENTQKCSSYKVLDAVWSNDAKQVAYSEAKGAICMMDLVPVGVVGRQCFPGTENALNLAWRP